MIRIVAIQGTYGTGKTYLATLLGYHYSRRGYRVYANYDVRFGEKVLPYALVDQILEGRHEPVPSIFLLDELHRYAESTRYNSKTNQFWRHWFDMCRKNKIYIVYTAQRIETVDKHIRENTDMVFTLHPANRDLIARYRYLEAYVYSALSLKMKRVIIPFYEAVARMYNTEEIIPPTSITHFAKKYVEKLEKYWEEVVG